MKKLLAIPFILYTCYLILTTGSAFADQTVSATISPKITDYQFTLSSPNDSNVREESTQMYVITYGAKPSAAFPTADTIIVANWSNDKAPNNADILGYVNGSATDGYGGVVPVVDLINKTITWTIPSLPSGTTDQTVSFQLRTNSDYTRFDPVNFTILANMSNQYVTMPEQSLLETYAYHSPPPRPTATPGPQPTTVPSPTPTPEIPTYNVSINGITGTNATVQIATNNPSKLTVEYGTSPTNLGQIVSTNSYQNVSILTLPDLTPDTTYYFRITIKGEDSTYYRTEIFTFKTATQSPSTLTGTAVISANGTVLLSEAYNQSMSSGFALLTSSFPYDVTVSLGQNAAYKSLESIIQKQLPINTLEMTQEQSGIYTADMPSLDSGTYSLFIKSLDDEGTLLTQKIADLRVIPPLQVTDMQSGAPLANARIFLSYFDQGSDSYKPFYPGLYGIQENPGYTDSSGVYAVNLPPGKYRVEASALFYDMATLDFTLGKGADETFPHIALKKDPTNIVSLVTVGKDYLVDNLIAAFIALHAIATSSRVFHVVATTTTGSLVLLGYLLFLLKSHSTLKYLPLFFFIHLDVMLQKHTGKYLFGKVTDAAGMPLSLVRVEVEDADTKTIIQHTTTNKTGKFYFLNKFANSVNLIFVKEGFHPATRALSDTGFPEQGLQIMLEKGTPHHPSAFVLLGRGFRDMLGMLFETALVLSIILEILFFFFYGFAKTAPFLILSFINIVLWLFYLRQQSSRTGY